jgi:four helix bundle protein
MQPRAYKKLETWQRAMDLVEEIYRATKTFPVEEKYGLTSQIRRASVSIPSNIAEGQCRRRTKTFAHHVSIALGSHGEVETCTELAVRLAFLTEPQFDALESRIAEVGRLLNGLHRSLETQLATEKAPRARRRLK